MEGETELRHRVNGDKKSTVEIKDNAKDMNNSAAMLTEIPVAPKPRNSVGSLNAVAEQSEDPLADQTGAQGQATGESVSPNKAPASGATATSGASGGAVGSAPARRMPHLHKLEK